MRALWLAVPLVVGVAIAAAVGIGAARSVEPPVVPVPVAAALAPAPEARAHEADEPARPARSLRVKARGQLGPGKGTLLIALQPPAGGKLSAGSPVSVRARGEHLSFPDRIRAPLDPEALPLRVPIHVTDGALGPANVELGFYWCDQADQGSCHPERVQLVVELDLSGDAAGGEAFVAYRASRG